jgi:hypothetical protein
MEWSCDQDRVAQHLRNAVVLRTAVIAKLPPKASLFELAID